MSYDERNKSGCQWQPDGTAHHQTNKCLQITASCPCWYYTVPIDYCTSCSSLSYPRRRQWLLYTASPSAGNTYVCTLGQLMHNKNKEGIKRSNQQVHVDAEAIFISTLGQHDNAENTKFTRCISCSFQWSFPLLSYTGWFVFFMSTNISITHILSYKIFFLFYLAWHKAVVICGQFT